MKKNNKGVTLIELIVAFAIVSVATIYFFQTVSLVKRMYSNAREETNNYANKTYAMRVLDTYVSQYGTIGLTDGKVCSQLLGGYCNKIETYVYSGSNKMSDIYNNTFLFKFIAQDSSNNTLFTLYKYNSNINMPVTVDINAADVGAYFTPHWGGWVKNNQVHNNIAAADNVFRVVRLGNNNWTSGNITYPIKYSGRTKVSFKTTTDDSSNTAQARVTLSAIDDSGNVIATTSNNAEGCNLVNNQCEWNSSETLEVNSTQDYRVKLEFTRTGGGYDNTIYISVISIEN